MEERERARGRLKMEKGDVGVEGWMENRQIN
jgi:hypothetical protein